ncbi:ATP-binding protein [Iamia sp.]|uniref:ATP-binding protein n=1 Tax=Iamia sp. TaxID=2722710 RepID=UPI002B9B5174|nr:ATP-binding protein [Iamia sp.]HXH56174.1 ATP-binding protein [Iamia sp.]
MDPISNPYSPGAGTPPPYLAGRDELQDAFATMIARVGVGNPVQPLVLAGLRGVGKTVLLLRWREIALKSGWATAHVEARADADLRGQLGDAIVDLLRQVSRQYRNRERVERLQRVAVSFLRATGATISRGGLAFGVDPEPGVADSGSLETDLTELLVELGHAAKDEGSGAVVLIDELQDAGSDRLVGVVGACHRVNQERLPVLIVGAGLPTVGKVLSDAKSYAERLFDLRRVGPLDREAQNQAIAEPAQELGVRYEPGALEALEVLAGGYPFFIQTHAKFVWDVAVESPITDRDVAVAAPRAGDQLTRSFFSPRYDRATPAERRYMHAMASRGDDAAPTAEVASALRRRPSDVSVQRDGLLNKGLVYAPERGLVAFTVPHMAGFLRTLPTHEFG